MGSSGRMVCRAGSGTEGSGMFGGVIQGTWLMA